MREMLGTDNLINFEEISLNSSDDSDMISMKNLNKIDVNIENSKSRGDLAPSKINHRLNSNDYN